MGIRDDLFRAMKNGEVTLVLVDLLEGIRHGLVQDTDNKALFPWFLED